MLSRRRISYNKAENHKRKHIAVTVCVAAVSGLIIFGTSDRMITSGDIQFEPQQSKIVPLTNSIVAQIAGDVSIQTEIMQRVSSDIIKRIQASPQEWWNVRDVAELYATTMTNCAFHTQSTTYLLPWD